MCFQIMNNIIDIDALKKFYSANRIGRNDHSLKVRIPYATRTDCFKYSYFIRTAIDWNNVPENIVQSSCLNTFKTSLGDHFIL